MVLCSGRPFLAHCLYEKFQRRNLRVLWWNGNTDWQTEIVRINIDLLAH